MIKLVIKTLESAASEAATVGSSGRGLRSTSTRYPGARRVRATPRGSIALTLRVLEPEPEGHYDAFPVLF